MKSLGYTRTLYWTLCLVLLVAVNVRTGLGAEGDPERVCDDYPKFEPSDGKDDEIALVKAKIEALINGLDNEPRLPATATHEEKDEWLDRQLLLRAAAKCALAKLKAGKLRKLPEGGALGKTRARPQGGVEGDKSGCGKDCIGMSATALCDPELAYGFPTLMHEGRHNVQKYPLDKWPETIYEGPDPCAKLIYRMDRMIREIEAHTVGYLSAQVDGAVPCGKYLRKSCRLCLDNTPNNGKPSYYEMFYTTWNKWKAECDPSAAEARKWEETLLRSVRMFNHMKVRYPCPGN